MIDFFIKKVNNTNIYLRILIIESNQVKNSRKKKALLICRIDFKSKTSTIIATLYYIKNKIKLDNIINQIKFENKKY